MKNLVTMFALVMALVSADAFAVLKTTGVAAAGYGGPGRNTTFGVKSAGVGTIAAPLKKNNYAGKHAPWNSVENGGICTFDAECKSGYCKNEVCTADPTSSDTNSPKSSN